MNLSEKPHVRARISWKLVPFDALTFFVYTFFTTLRWGFFDRTKILECALLVLALFTVTTLSRIIFGVYSQVWRFGGIQSYIRILVSDGVSFFIFLTVYTVLKQLANEYIPKGMSVIFIIAITGFNCLLALAPRMIYRYAYKCGDRKDLIGFVLRLLLRIFAGKKVYEQIHSDFEKISDSNRIKIAILGAGDTGTSLAQELLTNLRSGYEPLCFIEIDRSKTGRLVYSIPIYDQTIANPEFLKSRGVEVVVFAVPGMDHDMLNELREYYSSNGFGVKVYDFPTMDNLKSGGRRSIREFDISDLLFRQQKDFIDEKVSSYYKDKTVLVTGGGGSIGSELCRQLSRMNPKRLVVLDVYENGAYDLQQELKIKDKNFPISLEILSVCNRAALERVFSTYKPQIVIHAAAHKHVPLMEHNCTEAIENNIFGTLNTVELAEEYGCERFIMVSTDKAVNPTNVMGATKRFCEMIVMNKAAKSKKTVFSATRFGNVLGSAGSVIPLFRRQIAAGGPVTITDKKIIRYFMTIPEASQLVLESGPMAKKGELFVLDMGKPIKIYDMAVNMIKLCGLTPYVDIDIIETGLRPGEKLYEELLTKSDTLKKTQNDLMFIEKDTPVSDETMKAYLDSLRKALNSGDDEYTKQVLREVVPTYKKPEDVNSKASDAEEMTAAEGGKETDKK